MSNWPSMAELKGCAMLVTRDAELVVAIIALAAGELNEDELADGFRAYSQELR